MGFYVNPDNGKFKKALDSEIYIDKTMLLRELNRRINTEDRFVCVSRPRRFGKTMAERMMAAYYSKGCDSAGLFKDLKICDDPSFARHLNKYNVLHLDINGFLSDYGDAVLDGMRSEVMSDFRKEFPDADFSEVETIAGCLRCAYSFTSVPFIVVFDEYDCIFREHASAKMEDDYLMLLNAIFKSDAMSECIALAYLTGILPIIREKAQSKFNNFEDITFLNPGRFAEFTGFTSDEVEALCRRYGMDFAECRSWYDCYRIRGMDIYAPRPVVMAMQGGECRGYWSQTSQYEAILDPIRLDICGTKSDIEKMTSGESVGIDIGRFLNTPNRLSGRDSIFTCICHLGYLCYNPESESCRIPNHEIREEWNLEKTHPIRA